MRRLQVTAIWEIEEEDDVVSNIALTDLADELRREIYHSMGFDEPEHDGYDHNLRVDVAEMPHSAGEVRQQTPDNSIAQSFIFPDDHPLAAIERAYRSGKPPEQIALEMTSQIDSFKGYY